MASGVYQQCIVVLLRQQVAIETIESLLDEHQIMGRSSRSGNDDVRGEALRIAVRRTDRPSDIDSKATTVAAEAQEPTDSSWFIEIDLVDHPWPDAMGDPIEDRSLFVAWSDGLYGPHTLPGALQRAQEQSWRWLEAANKTASHCAMIRFRFGNEREVNGKVADGSPVSCADDSATTLESDPLFQLDALTRLARRFLELPASICLFNPAGEVLLDREGLQQVYAFSDARGLPPLDAWCNLRVVPLQEDHCLMDTIGHAQFQLSDLEASFAPSSYSCEEVDRFLRDITVYLLQADEPMGSGDWISGPRGSHWNVEAIDESLFRPTRRVLRLIPLPQSSATPESA